MKLDDLCTMARAAGLSGESWAHWTASDAVQDAIETIDTLDTDALESAFHDGVRALRSATWRIVWTTAPVAYDYESSVEALEVCGEWFGKPLRRVAIEPSMYVSQTSRYWSGLHAAWDEDPRIEEARAQARLDTERAERKAREEKRAVGLVWLQTATDAELDDFDTFEAQGVCYEDVKAEKKHRADVAEANVNAAEWVRCLAIVRDGVTLVDGGETSRDAYHRAPAVWYNVRIVRGHPDTADHAYVHCGSNASCVVGSVALVADWIVSGRLRVATDADMVPPYAVTKRIGFDRWKEIKCVHVGGKGVVWVGRPAFGNVLVLDANGRIVRARKVAAEAMDAYRAMGGY